MLLFTFLLAGAAVANSIVSLKCSRSLQEIIFQPRSFSKEYLEKVAIQFKTGSELLFTSQASAYIAQFEQQWGVSVSVRDPSNICAPASALICFDFGETFSGSGYEIDPNVPISIELPPIDPPIPYPIESFQVKVLRGHYSNNGSANSFFRSVLYAPDDTQPRMIGNNFCATQTFNISLSDSGAEYIGPGGTCSGFNTNPVSNFRPIDSFNEAFGGQSLLYGVWSVGFSNSNPNYSLFIEEITLTACYNQPVTSCSSDTMHSLLNVPGFRIDSGIAYYTEEVYSADGQLRIVTISRSIEGLFL